MHTEDHRYLMSLATLAAGFARAVLYLLAITFASAVISFPLWFAATRAPRVYAVVIVAALVGVALPLLWNRVHSRRWSSDDERRALRKATVRRMARHTSELLATAVLVYMGATFFVSRMPLAGAAVTLVLFAVLAALRMQPRRRA